MKRPKNAAAVQAAIDGCRERCVAAGVPFHADALAAALGISYEALTRYAAGEETVPGVAALLAAALQECTASVLTCAMEADPKRHAFYMWYLRNRGGFADKGGEPARPDGGVTFIGEGRI